MIIASKQEIIKSIMELSGSRSPYDVFRDWLECMTISISGSLTTRHDDFWREREERYARIVSSYGGDDAFARMFGLLQMALEEETSDVLGDIYMELDMKNKSTGQYFTPHAVADVMARIVVEDTEAFRLHEPSCGSGGGIIAVARELKHRGIQYQRVMEVIAQDLDWKAVYMCYVQLSLLGIKAVVAQGDTLTEPYCCKEYPKERVFYTPAEIWRIY